MEKSQGKSELLNALSAAAILSGAIGLFVDRSGKTIDFRNEGITCSALARARDLTHERFELSVRHLVTTGKEDEARFIDQEFGQGPDFAKKAQHCQDVWRINVTRGCAAKSVRRTLASGGKVPTLIVQDLKDETGKCKR